MSSFRFTTLPSRNRGGARAFTLIELLVTLGVVAALATVVTGLSQAGIKKAALAREMSAGKTLINAYLLHAMDNDGTLMVPLYEGSVTAEDAAAFSSLRSELVKSLPGSEGGFGDEVLHRYPYRLAPYFNYRLDGVIRINDNRRQIRKVFSENMRAYGTSLCPSFGINHYFLGGYKVDGELSKEQLADAAFKLVQVPRPSAMLVFATAFSPDGLLPERVDGRHAIEPPAFRTELWNENLHVDPRHDGRALCLFLDGSVRPQTVGELNDMRHWSKNAQMNDDPNYRVAAAGGTGIGGGGGGRR